MQACDQNIGNIGRPRIKLIVCADAEADTASTQTICP